MLETLGEFFKSFFASPTLLGIGLAIILGAIWLVAYWPPLFKRLWLWAVLISSALLTLAAISFIQIPLQSLTQQVLIRFWDQTVLARWLLLVGIPLVLWSGLVQEASKLLPVLVYRWKRDKDLSPKLGLMVGAVAGAGFGIFEAQWVFNAIFNSGWNWGTVQASGLIALAGFWERFFSIAFHISVSALAGYGLAKHRGWQFYLLASLLHALTNYGVILRQAGLLSIEGVELYIAVIALAITALTLWWRWRKQVKNTV